MIRCVHRRINLQNICGKKEDAACSSGRSEKAWINKITEFCISALGPGAREISILSFLPGFRQFLSITEWPFRAVQQTSQRSPSGWSVHGWAVEPLNYGAPQIHQFCARISGVQYWEERSKERSLYSGGYCSQGSIVEL